MKRLPTWRIPALLILATGLLAGCAAYGPGVYRPAERVVVRSPPPPPASTRLYQRTDRDARAYTRQISRAVRLAPAQQRVIHDRLAQRAFVLLDRTHPRDHRYIYPFPRRAHERDRTVRRFWRDVDRDIERYLDRHQRRAYRDYVRYTYERPLQRHRRHPHGGPPGQRRR